MTHPELPPPDMAQRVGRAVAAVREEVQVHRDAAHQNLTDAHVAVLVEQHPDPFVQAAVWRVYVNAPGLLDPDLARKLLNASMVKP